MITGLEPEAEAVKAAAPNALLMSFDTIDTARGGAGSNSYIAGTLLQADPNGHAVKSGLTNGTTCDGVSVCSDEVTIQATSGGTYRIRMWMKRRTTEPENHCKITIFLNNAGNGILDGASQPASVGSKPGTGGQLSTAEYVQVVWEVNVALSNNDELGWYVGSSTPGSATNCTWGAVEPSYNQGIAYASIERTGP